MQPPDPEAARQRGLALTASPTMRRIGELRGRVAAVGQFLSRLPDRLLNPLVREPL